MNSTPAQSGGSRANAEHDITVDGPELAAQAIRASLVDEFQMIVSPVVVGSGKRFFPDGVRLNLGLVEERRFRKAVIVSGTPSAAHRREGGGTSPASRGTRACGDRSRARALRTRRRS